MIRWTCIESDFLQEAEHVVKAGIGCNHAFH